VRYEGQVKQREQRELAETVIRKIQEELKNPKVLQQILQQSVADVESEFNVLVSIHRCQG
jgi:F-type H+-transporting ATPase subunit b